jgi:glyoxylase-like metal-dependent hydrolase (beta-lactamase superfamily II)
VDEPRELPVAAPWFSVTWVTGRTALITEPHVDPFLQGNVWYLRGRERDLLVDTGNGVAPLRPVLARFSRSERPREVVALITHAHADHVGGLHEFARRLMHAAETGRAAEPQDEAPLLAATWVAKLGPLAADDGEDLPAVLLDALPHTGFDPAAYRLTPAAPTHLVQGGDVVDLGGRTLTVVELPGHTPGSIGLIDDEERALVSGDAIYDDELIDTLPESDVDHYARTMERLRALDVDVVYPGHGAPFGRARLTELAAAYLRRAGA